MEKTVKAERNNSKNKDSVHTAQQQSSGESHLLQLALQSLDFELVLVDLSLVPGWENDTSHVTRHTSHVTHHTSHVTRHTSHVTRQTSHVSATSDNTQPIHFNTDQTNTS